MKGFAYLLLFFAFILFSTFLVLAIYSSDAWDLEPFAAFYEPALARADLEATISEHARAGILAYLAYALVDPFAVSEDIKGGGKVFKDVVRTAVFIGMEGFAASYDPNLNSTCFCAPFDEAEWKIASKESASSRGLFLPKGAVSVGFSCRAVDVLLLNYSPPFIEVDVILSNSSWRVACISQSGPYANIEILKPKLNVLSGDSSASLGSSLNVSDFFE